MKRIADNFKSFLFIFSLALLADFNTLAQGIIIPVETRNSAMVLQVSSNKDVNIIYHGKKLSNDSGYNQIPGEYKQPRDYTGMLSSAYTPSGTRNLMEPAINVTHADGNNSLDLKYVSHSFTALSPEISLISVMLKDPVYDFEVILYYKSYLNMDIIEQWSVIRHREKGNVLLHKFATANLYLKAGSYWLKQFHGDWAKEMQPEELLLGHGIKTLDSKLGTRADLFQPPSFIVSMNNPATEDEGEVIFGTLEWSGNFRFDFEVDPLDNLRIIAGINNYASEYSLKPGEEFATPPLITVFSEKGKGEASRRMHDWARKYKIADGNGDRLTLLNNWESTYFDFNEEKLVSLLKDTRKLGVDMFLLDDGWFGNKYPRNDDHAGLGDWQENIKKLPNGISSLVKGAKDEGVKFGLWIEPEMINPKSELYGRHPEWVIKQPKREEFYFRNQLVLDLSNPEVQDFVFEIVDNLMTENPGLAFLKWDCNAVIYNAYSSYLENQSHLYIKYVNGLYRVLDRIRDKYPKLPMMLCSGGGGRVDYGALKYFTEYWPSDNTDPLERIFIQWENSYFFPAKLSCNHVTNWGKQSLKFKTDVAMMGKLGFDIVVNKLNPSELEFCQNAVRTYNSVKNIIWQGNQYRLADPSKSSVASMLFVDQEKTKAVLFNYLVNYRYGEGSKLPIRLKGLEAGKKYKVQEINMEAGSVSTVHSTYTGEFLMSVGINPDVNTGRTSVVLELEEIR